MFFISPSHFHIYLSIPAGVSRLLMSHPLRPQGLQPARLLCPWNSPGKDTKEGGHSLIKGIFLTQGLNLGVLHCRQILYHLSCQGSPSIHLLSIYLSIIYQFIYHPSVYLSISVNHLYTYNHLSSIYIPNLEKETATHSAVLAWRIPWTQEPSKSQSIGLQRVRHH